MSTPQQPANGIWPNSSQQGPTPNWGQPNPAWGRPAPAWGGQPLTNPRQPPAAPRNIPSRSIPGSAPLGAPTQPTVSLDQYRPRRSRGPVILIAILAVAVIAGVLYFGLRPDPTPSSAPSSSTSASATPRPTSSPVSPGQNATSVPFESERVSGVFSINHAHWEGSTLVVNVTIQVDSGSLSYKFMTMDVSTGGIYEVLAPSNSGDLRGGTISAGNSATGNVRVQKPYGDTQLLLSDANTSRNLTMLVVPN